MATTKKSESVNLIESFAEFKETKNIDRAYAHERAGGMLP